MSSEGVGPEPGPEDEVDLPIHPLEPESQKARIALRIADEELDLVVFSYSTDLRRPEQVRRLREELGGLRRGRELVLPDDGGVHYLFYVTMRGSGCPLAAPRPLLVAETQVAAVVLGLAAAVGLADRVQYALGQLP